LKSIVVALIAVVFPATWLFASSEEIAVRKAPELAFTVPGKGQQLLSQFRGKVVALEFILTTCPHCQQASKTMTQFQNEFGPRGFQAIDLAINGLDEGRNESQANELVQAFARDYRVGFSVGWITRDPMMSFMGFSLADRMVVPQLVLIDRKGMIRYQTPAGSTPEWEKLMNEATLRQHIEELLSAPNGASERSPRPRATAAKKSY
jgi:thiol-disulfide isomerase/thioredoxin